MYSMHRPRLSVPIVYMADYKHECADIETVSLHHYRVMLCTCHCMYAELCEQYANLGIDF